MVWDLVFCILPVFQANAKKTNSSAALKVTRLSLFPGSSPGSAILSIFLLTQCQSCPISQQLEECFESHLKYFTKKKIRSTCDHVHISVKPLRLDLYWPIYPISPGAGEGELYPASVCLMASAASGARAGPWSPVSRGQSRGQTQTIGAGAETRSRREESQRGGEHWLQPPEGGHRCPLYTEHKTRSSRPEKGNFTESSAQTKMISFRYYLNIEFDRYDVDMTKCHWLARMKNDVLLIWFELIVILMSETSGQGPTGSLPFLFWSCQKCQRRQTLNDNDTNFINIVKISLRNTWDITDNCLRKEIIL